MKGVVFIKLLELVEKDYGLEYVDDLIENSMIASKGSYTTIGDYSALEMDRLLDHLSIKTSLTKDALLRWFGKYFFDSLKKRYSGLLNQYHDPIELIANVENHINAESFKIYPKNKLPSFDLILKTKTTLEFICRSEIAMYSFGHSLIEKSFDHYGVRATIEIEKIKPDGTEVKFSILRNV